jgi:hypothetical protein
MFQLLECVALFYQWTEAVQTGNSGETHGLYIARKDAVKDY